MCGFCTPGFVMATRRRCSRSIRTRRPSRSSKGLDGNICRCGTFIRIFEAVLEREGGGAWLTHSSTAAGRPRRRAAAADRESESTRGRAKPAVIGTSRQAPRRPRQGDRAAPSTRFDINRPGMLYGTHRPLAASARARRRRSICPRRRRRPA